MKRSCVQVISLSAALILGAFGCGSSDDDNGGTADAGGKQDTASAQTFKSVKPCMAETDYTTTGNKITFADSDIKYTPKCLKVAKGTEVEFAGTFMYHNLKPSAKRGDEGDAIKTTTTGTSAKFTFTTAGFFAYFCSTHEPADDGSL